MQKMTIGIAFGQKARQDPQQCGKAVAAALMFFNLMFCKYALRQPVDGSRFSAVGELQEIEVWLNQVFNRAHRVQIYIEYFAHSDPEDSWVSLEIRFFERAEKNSFRLLEYAFNCLSGQTTGFYVES